MRLAARLEAEQSHLEERMGKPFGELTRPEAKDWIKRLRAMADEIAPTGRVRFGQWPGAREDREAVYLTQQRDAAAQLTFKLFNGEQFTGTIADFTPYTITIRADGSEVVLRKLAIAYYRQAADAGSVDGAEPTVGDEQPASQAAPEAAVKEAAPRKARASAKAAPEVHQPVVDDLESDRPDVLQTPEADNMDEDRGI